MSGEEATRQLHENVASNIEQDLAATPHKAPTIRPPTSHHENYPTQTNQTCRAMLEKQGRAHKCCTPMDSHIWPGKAGRPARTYIQQLCEDTGCSPEDLPEAMNDREKWRKRISVPVTRHDDDDDDDTMRLVSMMMMMIPCVSSR